jgi:formylglycine-generating enzyme required for sulfatase activity
LLANYSKFNQTQMKRNHFAIIIALVLISEITLGQSRGFIKERLEAKDHIALIIGNGSYPDAPLTNPRNDAQDVSTAFKEMGFIVETMLDADREEMAQAVQRFSQKLRTAKAAVFYFAGHGMQVNGENYLIPIGNTSATQITEESHVPWRAYNANEILQSMEQSKVNFSLVILDACRNNPLKGSGRGKVPGLAAINAPVGSLVMYATKAGAIASDGENSRNSPFTTAFLEHIKTPGLDVNLLPSRITKTVGDITNGSQIPGSYMQLNQSFTFIPELTPEELKRSKEYELKNLQELETETIKIREEEEAILAKKQLEIDELDRRIQELKEKSAGSGSLNTSNDLDRMLTFVRELETQKKELNEMQRKADEARNAREKELFEIKHRELKIKSDQLDEDLSKFTEISTSEFGKDMAQTAWDNILSKWGIEKGTIPIGAKDFLKFKIIPDMLSSFIDMVFVEGGKFTIGCNTYQDKECFEVEKPATEVHVKNFYISKYEITQGQWSIIMGNNPSINIGCDNCPVENVSWNDIQNFLKKIYEKTGFTYRLPSEAEWEYAARGGSKSNGYIFSGSNEINEIGWIQTNSENKTQPVGTKSPNELGLYDMTGNVWEWCNEPLKSYPYSNDPKNQRYAANEKIVLRGSSFNNSTKLSRVSFRNSNVPDAKSANFGFRLVLDKK